MAKTRNLAITGLFIGSLISYLVACFLPSIHQFGENGLVNISPKDYAGWECLVWGILSPWWWVSNPLLFTSWGVAITLGRVNMGRGRYLKILPSVAASFSLRAPDAG